MEYYVFRSSFSISFLKYHNNFSSNTEMNNLANFLRLKLKKIRRLLGTIQTFFLYSSPIKSYVAISESL